MNTLRVNNLRILRIGADDEAEHTLAAKIQRLHFAAKSGLPVPLGWALQPSQAPFFIDAFDKEDAKVEGPQAWILRMALAHEDGETQSYAGLGRSISSIRDRNQYIQALDALKLHAEKILPELLQGDDDQKHLPTFPYQLLLQREVKAQQLLVILRSPEGITHLEAHPPGEDRFSGQYDPDYHGALGQWGHPSRRAVEKLVDDVQGRFPDGFVHGWDLEVAVDQENRPWLVQLRPITRDLFPSWSRFKDMAGEELPQQEHYELDAEHNPDALSPAHEWLIQWLIKHRPEDYGSYKSIGGWLYRRRPKEKTPKISSLQTRKNGMEDPVFVALERLHTQQIPQARRAFEDYRNSLRSSAPDDAAHLLQKALNLFMRTLDIYLKELAPLQTHDKQYSPIAHRPKAPLSLQARQKFLDVLPVHWDIASPPLLDVIPRNLQPYPPHEYVAPRTQEEARQLIREWDDHLFALGMAGLRAFWLHRGQILGVGKDIFLLNGKEILKQKISTSLLKKIEQGKEKSKEQEKIQAPLSLLDGQPVPFAHTTYQRGFPIGPPVQGRLVYRRDLQHLLQERLPENSILCMPNLNAQAAVVLAQQNILGVCTEHGGPLSHASLMLRELQISALIACKGCSDIPEDSLVSLDTKTGMLRRIGPSPSLTR